MQVKATDSELGDHQPLFDSISKTNEPIKPPIVIKIYDQEWEGQNPDDWFNDWAKINPLDHYQFVSQYSRFLPLFEPYLKPGLRVLEAGCGLGGYLIHYRKHNIDIVGIDFSKPTVDWVKSVIPDCPIFHGSIDQIPFPDQTFDTVISLGVLEHFEEGPEKALQELRRILKPDGLLILDVPFYSPAFRLHLGVSRLCRHLGFSPKHPHHGISSPSGQGWYKRVKRMERESVPHFSYYAFQKSELFDCLKEQDFEVIHSRRCSIEYGLRDFLIWLRILPKPVRRKTPVSEPQAAPRPRTIQEIETPSPKPSSWVKTQLQDIFLRERGDTVLKQIVIGALRLFCPHLLLVVAKPRRVFQQTQRALSNSCM